jgi:hypothetical protein
VAGEVLYDADIEPDADHDGYGDATQDGCPTDTATQAACPAVAPAEPGSPGSAGQPGTGTGPAGGTRPQATTPAISGLRAVYKRFRVKRDGAVIARRRPHAGTTLRLRLSEVAAVTFSFALKRPVACPPVRKNQRCTRWVFVHAFKRDLAAGPSSVAYSGRYRRDGKTRSLEPGTYRMSVVAINAAGTASRTRRIALTVRPGTARSPRSPG